MASPQWTAVPWDRASQQGGLPRPHAVKGGFRAPEPGPAPREPTGVRPQVAREGVPPAAGVVTQVALEGLLPRVQLDVAEQVALLREGGPTLAALERPLSWEEDRALVRAGLQGTGG